MLKHCSFAAAFAAFTFVASHAAAEAKDPAAAQALFDDAGNLMNAGRDAEACPKLEESQRLDPGIGTLFHLADCYEKIGRVASAWAAFLDVASQARAAGQSDREEAANARAARLEPRLPKIKIRVPTASRVEGLAIRRDGIEVGSVTWGTPMPVDPGKHVVVASAPGRRSLVRNVTAEEGVVVDLELTPLLDENPQHAATPAVVPATPPSEQHPAGHSVNVWPWVFAGAGVVSAGIGTAFAVMASSDNKDSKSYCRADQPNVCKDPGIELRNSAITKGNVATGAFAASAGFAAVAVTLWLVGGSSSHSSSASAPLTVNPVLGANVVGADLGGSF